MQAYLTNINDFSVFLKSQDCIYITKHTVVLKNADGWMMNDLMAMK